MSKRSFKEIVNDRQKYERLAHDEWVWCKENNMVNGDIAVTPELVLYNERVGELLSEMLEYLSQRKDSVSKATE